jgi:hypothetical protein
MPTHNFAQGLLQSCQIQLSGNLLDRRHVVRPIAPQLF